MDSLEVAQQIIQLYQQHVNKSSGEMNKDDLKVPIVFNAPDGAFYDIDDVSYVSGIGIILQQYEKYD